MKFLLLLVLVGVSALASVGEARVVDIAEDDWEKLLKGEWMVEL